MAELAAHRAWKQSLRRYTPTSKGAENGGDITQRRVFRESMKQLWHQIDTTHGQLHSLTTSLQRWSSTHEKLQAQLAMAGECGHWHDMEQQHLESLLLAAKCQKAKQKEQALLQEKRELERELKDVVDLVNDLCAEEAGYHGGDTRRYSDNTAASQDLTGYSSDEYFDDDATATAAAGSGGRRGHGYGHSYAYAPAAPAASPRHANYHHHHLPARHASPGAAAARGSYRDGGDWYRDDGAGAAARTPPPAHASSPPGEGEGHRTHRYYNYHHQQYRAGDDAGSGTPPPTIPAAAASGRLNQARQAWADNGPDSSGNRQQPHQQQHGSTLQARMARDFEELAMKARAAAQRLQDVHGAGAAGSYQAVTASPHAAGASQHQHQHQAHHHRQHVWDTYLSSSYDNTQRPQQQQQQQQERGRTRRYSDGPGSQRHAAMATAAAAGRGSEALWAPTVVDSPPVHSPVYKQPRAAGPRAGAGAGGYHYYQGQRVRADAHAWNQLAQQLDQELQEATGNGRRTGRGQRMAPATRGPAAATPATIPTHRLGTAATAAASDSFSRSPLAYTRLPSPSLSLPRSPASPHDGGHSSTFELRDLRREVERLREALHREKEDRVLSERSAQREKGEMLRSLQRHVRDIMEHDNM